VFLGGFGACLLQRLGVVRMSPGFACFASFLFSLGAGFLGGAFDPLLTTLDEDALQLLTGWFVASTFLAGELGFGGDEAAFDCCLEDRGVVALEVLLCSLQLRDCGIEPRQIRLDRLDDAMLLLQ